MDKTEILGSYDENILTTYTKVPYIFVKGKGSLLTDIHGKKFLDFFPGWGVSNLGHCHPKVVAAVRDQIDKLIHIPNNLYHPNQAKLARELIRVSFPGRVFFCNSGTEANEAAIKFCRAYGEGKRFEIITTANSFHGRTMGSLAATGQAKHQQGFAPLPQGFSTVPFNDLEAIRSAVNDKTVAIMLELIQGEGGIHIALQEYIQAIRRLCDERKILMVIDEIQTGMGRTGEMFAFKHYGIKPDIMTLAKALGGGLPIGAMIVDAKFSGVFKPGMHGSTFAGSPLIAKAALAVLKVMSDGKVLRNVKTLEPYLRNKLNGLMEKLPCIKDVRGVGLMFGVEVKGDIGPKIFSKCLEHGLIINCTQGNVLRIMPALIVTKKQIDRAVNILGRSMEEVLAQH
jgi:predicted acetylornithine/succinylornithine family transaminase